MDAGRDDGLVGVRSKPYVAPIYEGAWYVAPNGADYATGQASAPFSLRAALTKAMQSPATAGQQIYLRGGHYVHDGQLVVDVGGSEGNPLTISNYPNEAAIIHCPIRQTGAHVRWLSTDYGLIRADTSTDRVGDPPASMASGIVIEAAGVDVINLRVENVVGTGIDWFAPYAGQIYGCIVHSNGYVGSGRDHGPGIYTANDNPAVEKALANLILLNNARYSVQAADGGYNRDVLNYRLRDIAAYSLYVGSTRVDGCQIERLYLYGVAPKFGQNSTSEVVHGSLTLTESVVDGVVNQPPSAFSAEKFTSLTVADNQFTSANYDNLTVPDGTYNIQAITPVTNGQFVNLVPNTYAPDYATLTVFDFDEVGSVACDVSDWLLNGAVRVHNPMLWNEALELAVTDGVVSLPMTGWTTPLPTGFDTSPWGLATVFSAHFGAFILRKL